MRSSCTNYVKSLRTYQQAWRMGSDISKWGSSPRARCSNRYKSIVFDWNDHGWQGLGSSECQWFPSFFGMVILYLCHQKACEKNVIFFEPSILQGMGTWFFRFEIPPPPDSKQSSILHWNRKVQQHTPVLSFIATAGCQISHLRWHAPPSQLPSSESPTASFWAPWIASGAPVIGAFREFG